MKQKYAHDLEQLRQRLKSKSLSVLVGAGFSKNVHETLFLTWRQLLEKMASRMNEKVYASSFERETGNKANAKDKKYQDYVKYQINQYLEQTDYLQVVSDYTKKMGYRETVDVCIEESIPLAVRRGGKLFLVNTDENGKKLETEILLTDLQVHTKLIRLPWNNIYTTNYDNLLEFCINEDAISGLESQTQTYEQEIKQLNNKLQSLLNESEEITEKINSINTTTKNPIAQFENYDTDDAVIQESDYQESLRQLTISKSNLYYQITQTQYQIDDSTNRKLKLEEAINDSYKVVKHSSQLAIKRNRNIIKLHGSLPIDENDEFSFDNEFDKRYIISQNDYEQYPSRHEAFTQLMRISLLQGHFCLIGFSGDDPNFMAWISWVRSIITRDTKSGNGEIKIYFIDARSAAPPDSHKMRFYKNHRIEYIPLCHPDCLSLFKLELGRNIEPSDTKALLDSTMDYLAGISIPDLSQISYEILTREKYTQLWEKVKSHRTMVIDMNAIVEACQAYEGLNELRRYNRIPEFSHPVNLKKFRFLSNIGELVTNNKFEDTITTKLLSLIVMAIEDLFIPYSLILQETEFIGMVNCAKKLSEELYRSFLKVDLKDAIWKCDTARINKLRKQLAGSPLNTSEEDIIILQLMDAAISLQFSKLKNLLELNITDTQFLTTSAGYWFHFNPKAGSNLLAHQTSETAQEQMYALEISQILNAGKNKTEIIEKRQKLKHEGLTLIEDNQKYAISQLRPKNRVEPYEDDGLLGRSITFDNSDRQLIGFQTLGMMLETGFPFSGNGYYFQDKDEVYPIFQQVYERFPMPVLFFAFQYSDQKFIKRVAQDFTFNEKVDIDPEKLFGLLSRAYSDPNAPSQYRVNIFHFLSVYINILAPRIWQPFFKKIWDEKKSENTLFTQDLKREMEFIEHGLRYCQDADIISLVLTDCLQAAIKDSATSNTVVQYLYRLANNPFHKTLKSSIKRKVNSQLFDCVIAIVINDPDYLFIVGNLHSYLSKNQVKQVEQNLLNIKYEKFAFSNLWSVAVHYCGQDQQLKRKLINEILKSSSLWDTGLLRTADGKISFRRSNNYVPIRKLRKGDGAKGLLFSKNDKRSIYLKLKSNLEDIKTILDRRDDLVDDFFPLLQEMSWFLDAEERLLKSEPDFSQIVDELSRYMFKGNKAQHKLSGLCSDDTTAINESITDVAIAIYDKGEFVEQGQYIRLIISKILLKKGPGIILCLEYIVSWCRHFKNSDHLKLYAPEFREILDSYKDNYPVGLYNHRLEELLVELAIVLESWGYKSEGIMFFVQKLGSSRFINIKYNLNEKIKRRKDSK